MAVILLKKIDGNNNSEMEGYCYDCAKKKGINPLDVLAKQSGITEEQIDNISKQFETMLGEITEDISSRRLRKYRGRICKFRFNIFKYIRWERHRTFKGKRAKRAIQS